jgi:carbamoyltransferase
VKLPNSLGFFYGAATKALGFKPNRHEGKVTGLAAYKPPLPESDMFCRSIATCKDGELYTPYIYGSFPEMQKVLEKVGKEAFAASFQKRLEETLVDYVKYHLKLHPQKRICLAGGVFANVKLNQRIAQIPGVEEIFVFPAMADVGLSVGSAVYHEPAKKIRKIRDVYLGPQYSEEEIRKELEANRVQYSKPSGLAKTIAEKLIQGRVVARFDGRMEFGPRALGNRTIMYETKDPTVNAWLNKNLRRTEFMPFAPVTLKEHARECYIDVHKAWHSANFMTVTFDCTEKMRKDSPAVVHVDGTARPQIIDRDTNAGYYDIVAEYHKITGIPSLVNTSFNMHEEPIVCSPYDAIRSYQLGHLDDLVVGPFLVENDNGISKNRKG